MFINFKYILVKNFLSYGNSETKLEFTPGMNLTTASNGGGKSSILLDAVSYALYGKPYREIKVGELINRKNKKGLFVEVSFEVDGKDSYKIIRTQSPNKLEIYKNGLEKPLESASSKLLDQEEINKILGIDYDLFKLIIAIATNYNKPFLSLGIAKKREIIESIFSINIFGEMLKKARNRFNSAKTEKTIVQNSLKNLESLILTLKKQIEDTEKSIKNFDEEKQKELDKLNSQKIEVERNIKNAKKELEELNDKLKEYKEDTTDYSSEQIKLSTSIKSEENSIKDKKKQILFLNKDGNCPLCGNVITEEHKNKEIEKLNSDIKKSETKIKTCNNKLVELNSKIENQRKVKNEISSISQKISMKEYSKKSLEKDSTNIKNQIETVNQRKLDIDLNPIKKDYDTKIEVYKEDSKRQKILDKDFKNFDIISKMLSEEGIKSYFFKRLVPILNSKINEYLNLFDLPVSISFDETMQETLSIIGSTEKDISYMAFSEGEKKRIDIAILLAFIGTTKSISNWNCNLLVFDEILDSATDAEGLEKLLSSIKDLTNNDNTLCAYIVSHRETFLDMYTKVIKIKKVGGYSKIEVQ